jgi:hypothetical protein
MQLFQWSTSLSPVSPLDKRTLLQIARDKISKGR